MTCTTSASEEPISDHTTETEPVDGDTFPTSTSSGCAPRAPGTAPPQRPTKALAPLQQRLHGLLVAGTGRLPNPCDLPFDAAHLEDEAVLTTAMDDLLARKPHLTSRRVVGDLGQGAGPRSPRSALPDARGTGVARER